MYSFKSITVKYGSEEIYPKLFDKRSCLYLWTLMALSSWPWNIKNKIDKGKRGFG